MLTFNEYKHLEDIYKIHGLLQFIKSYEAHKDKQIEVENLHWGDEIEYHLYLLDKEGKSVQMACDADHIVEKFT